MKNYSNNFIYLNEYSVDNIFLLESLLEETFKINDIKDKINTKINNINTKINNIDKVKQFKGSKPYESMKNYLGNVKKSTKDIYKNTKDAHMHGWVGWGLHPINTGKNISSTLYNGIKNLPNSKFVKNKTADISKQREELLKEKNNIESQLNNPKIIENPADELKLKKQRELLNQELSKANNVYAKQFLSGAMKATTQGIKNNIAEPYKNYFNKYGAGAGIATLTGLGLADTLGVPGAGIPFDVAHGIFNTIF